MLIKNKISVIVPIYNAERFLKKCISSIVSQSYSNLEIILIDDGSTDNSGMICDQYAAKDTRIKVIHKKNNGVSDARNDGIKCATGDYISFVDADDYLELNMYDLMLKIMIEKNVNIVICNYFAESEDGKQIYSQSSKNQIIDRNNYPQKMYDIKSIKGYCCNKLYSMKLFKQILETEIFNTNIFMAEDDLVNYKIFKYNRNFSAYYIDNKLYHYIIREESSSNNKMNDKKFTYFEVKIREINILESEKLKCDYLKIDYLFELKKNWEFVYKKNESYQSYIDRYNMYKKEIKITNVDKKSLIKYILIIIFPSIIKYFK